MLRRSIAAAIIAIVVSSCGLEVRGRVDERQGGPEATRGSDGGSSPQVDGGAGRVNAAAQPDGGPVINAGNPCADVQANIRICVAGGSGVCSGGTPMMERECPPMSACSGGHCQPPSGAKTCAQVTDCTAPQVCILFVVSAALSGRCSDPMPRATTAATKTCATNAECTTGICSVDGEDAAHVKCLSPCGSCGGDCHAIGSPAAIEGVPVSGLRACYN